MTAFVKVTKERMIAMLTIQPEIGKKGEFIRDSWRKNLRMQEAILKELRWSQRIDCNISNSQCIKITQNATEDKKKFIFAPKIIIEVFFNLFFFFGTKVQIIYFLLKLIEFSRQKLRLKYLIWVLIFGAKIQTVYFHIEIFEFSRQKSK